MVAIAETDRARIGAAVDGVSKALHDIYVLLIVPASSWAESRAAAVNAEGGSRRDHRSAEAEENSRVLHLENGRRRMLKDYCLKF